MSSAQVSSEAGIKSYPRSRRQTQGEFVCSTRSLAQTAIKAPIRLPVQTTASCPEVTPCYETVVPCAKLDDSCNNPCTIPRDCGYGIGSWGWLVAFLLVFIAFVIFWWVVIYSANPEWVQTNGVIDSTKVLLWAVVVAFATSLILVGFKIIYDKYMCKGSCA